MKSFGVVIACCAADAHYAMGCFASIRRFMHDVPVCFLYDGDKIPQALRGLPGTQVMTKRDVLNPELRARSFGPGLTKMIVLFEAPFETFLYLDADTTICGDLRRIADLERWDFVVDHRGYYSDDAIDQWFFDTGRMRSRFPDFAWESHRCDYFCTGTFFGRRGVLSLVRYMELLDVLVGEPDLFKFWEMGLLNFMLFEAHDSGRARIGKVPYQLVTRDHDSIDLRARFVEEMKMPELGSSPVVFHYPVTKPHLRQRGSFTEPMSYFRREFSRKWGNRGWIGSEFCLNVEDLRRYWFPKLMFSIRRSLAMLYRYTGVRAVVKRVASYAM